MLFDLLNILSYIIHWEPLSEGQLELRSIAINNEFNTYISLSDRYSEQNNIEPNTIIDGVYVIYINKKTLQKHMNKSIMIARLMI